MTNFEFWIHLFGDHSKIWQHWGKNDLQPLLTVTSVAKFMWSNDRDSGTCQLACIYEVCKIPGSHDCNLWLSQLASDNQSQQEAGSTGCKLQSCDFLLNDCCKRDCKIRYNYLIAHLKTAPLNNEFSCPDCDLKLRINLYQMN